MRIAATELPYGEKLDDALLRLEQSVVSRVQRLLDFLESDLLVAGTLVPRQREDPVEVGSDDLIFAGRR